VLERYSNTKAEAVLLVVSQVHLQHASVVAFVQRYSESIVLCYSSERTDAETGSKLEQWTIYGMYSGTLDI